MSTLATPPAPVKPTAQPICAPLLSLSGQGESLADDLLDLVARLVGLTEPLRVTIERPGLHVSLEVTAPPQGEPYGPPRPPHPCKALVLDILTKYTPRRLASREIMDEFCRLSPSGVEEWSERTVHRFLKELRQDGLVDNLRRDGERGSGYGLTARSSASA